MEILSTNNRQDHHIEMSFNSIKSGYQEHANEKLKNSDSLNPEIKERLEQMASSPSPQDRFKSNIV